jgi:diguanylate cyclase (GGDEF)-like protein
MATGVAVHLDLAFLLALLACAVGLGALAGPAYRSLASRARHGREARSGFGDRLHTRQSGQEGDAILRGRIDHLDQICHIWGIEARQAALRQISETMKRSVRRADPARGWAGDVVEGIEGDGFTVLVRGASEREASDVARRLRRELARTDIEGLAGGIRLNASFGVAGRRSNENFANWFARAEEALRFVPPDDEDGIIEASFVEDIRLLPPPDAPPQAQQAA